MSDPAPNASSPDSLDEMNGLISQLETERKSTIIPLFFTQGSSIDDEAVSSIYNFLQFERRLQKCETLEVMIHSSGGDLDATLHLCQILRSFSDNLKMIVPRYAKSAATLLVLSSDSLVMDVPSELGPLDPQWTESEGGYYTPLAIPKTIEFLQEIEKQLPQNSRIIERIAEKLSVEKMGLYKASLDYAVQPMIDLLTSRMLKDVTDKESKSKAIAERFTRGYPQHGYPIGITEAQRLGLKVERMTPEQWEKAWRIWRLFHENYF